VSSVEEAHGYIAYQGKCAYEFTNAKAYLARNGALQYSPSAGPMQVSKADLKRLLAQDKITPLVPQKRGRKPKATPHND
jgi:hypothetical protein